MPLTPQVKWAQRADRIYVTIALANAEKANITLTEDKLSFAGKGGEQQTDYAVDMELHGKIDVEASKRVVNQQHLFFNLVKKEDGYWPRLLKDATKQHWLKTDFDKWKEEDESEDEEDAKMNSMGQNFDMNAMMQQMGGMGGMGGMDGMDMSSMMGGMGGAGGMDMSSMMAGMGGPSDSGDAEADSDDDDMPGLE